MHGAGLHTEGGSEGSPKCCSRSSRREQRPVGPSEAAACRPQRTPGEEVVVDGRRPVGAVHAELPKRTDYQQEDGRG